MVQVGDIVECEVVHLFEDGINTKLEQKLFGYIPYIHLSDTPVSHPCEKFKKGDKLKCRVLALKSKYKVFLTNKPSLVNSQLPIIDNYNSIKNFSIAEGTILVIKDTITVGFYNNVKGFISQSELKTLCEGHQIFFPGQTLKCKVVWTSPLKKQLHLTLQLNEIADLQPGKLIDCEIISKNKKGLKVMVLHLHVPAWLPTMHLSDSVSHCRHLLNILKQGQIIKDCMVFRLRNKIIITKKKIIIEEERKHLKARGFEDIKLDSQLFGVIQKITSAGLYIILIGDLKGIVPQKFIPKGLNCKVLQPNFTIPVKVELINTKKKSFIFSLLIDDHTEANLSYVENFIKEDISIHFLHGLNDPLCSFSVSTGNIHKLTITHIDSNYMIGLTRFGLKGNVSDYHMKEKNLDLKVGNKVMAAVLQVDWNRNCLIMSVRRDVIGNIQKKLMDSTVHLGQLLHARILHVSDDVITVLVRGLKSNFIAYMPKEKMYWHHQEGKYFIGNVLNVEIKRIFDRHVLVTPYFGKMAITSPKPKSLGSDSIRKRPLSITENNDAEKNTVPEKKKKTLFKKVEKKAGDENLTIAEKNEKTLLKKKQVKKKEMLCLEVNTEFSWEDPFKLTSLGAVQQVDSSSSSSDEEKESEEIPETTKKRHRNRLKERLEEEQKLYESEKLLMDEDRPPETADDFDRMALASPNSSVIWLRYMAYHLQFAEVEKARAIAERALKTISFREDQEKFNVWVALLNLENLYGTQESLNETFQKALEQNDALKVYQQLVNIYMKSNKNELAEQLYTIMTKKFNRIPQVWSSFGIFYMKNGRLDSARRLLDKSLKSLETKTQVDLIAKFAHMEFTYGEVDRGKTMFENILANYRKRTDLWSVYTDMLIKVADYPTARQVFQRALTLNLSLMKKKFFFKKFLQFEKQYGDSDSVAKVKEKLQEFVLK